MPHQRQVKTQDIVVMFTKQHLTMQEIGTLFNMTRQAVCKRLRKAKIPATAGSWVPSVCAFCNAELKIRRKRWHRTEKQYCNLECYVASLQLHPFVQWRQGGRLARALVSGFFPLEPGHIVHHKNGDQRNNDLANLAVFATNADHMAHHRGRKVQPIWDGALAKRTPPPF